MQVVAHECLPKTMKSREMKESFCEVVQSQLFEEAVLEKVAKHRPRSCPSKKAIDKAVAENSACVTGLMNKTLDPALKKAAQVRLYFVDGSSLMYVLFFRCRPQCRSQLGVTLVSHIDSRRRLEKMTQLCFVFRSPCRS